ncbi:MAG: GntR family transcriptional regulator [Pseudomonadota bacterium]
MMDGSISEADRAPRYQQVADAIQARIAAGEHAVGAALPTEQALCDAYGVSRYTVREALRRLASLGLVRRRQGSGTEVVAKAPPATYLHAMRSLSELYEYAADTRLDVAHAQIAVPDDGAAAFLGRRPGRRWIELSGVRWTRDDVPISWSWIYIHDEFEAALPELADHDGPLYQLLETRHGACVEEVVQEIAAEPLLDAAAAALGEPRGAPGVRVVRRYLGEGDKPLIVSLSWHVAARFRYSMRLRREEGGV